MQSNTLIDIIQFHNQLYNIVERHPSYLAGDYNGSAGFSPIQDGLHWFYYQELLNGIGRQL